MKMRTIKLPEPSRNFHLRADLTIRVPEGNIQRYSDYGEEPHDIAHLTVSQTKRIDRHYCGLSGCMCGASPQGMEYHEDGTSSIHLY